MLCKVYARTKNSAQLRAKGEHLCYGNAHARTRNSISHVKREIIQKNVRVCVCGCVRVCVCVCACVRANAFRHTCAS